MADLGILGKLPSLSADEVSVKPGVVRLRAEIEPLVAFIKQVLAPGGVCLLTDQDRIPSHALRATLEREGFSFTTQIARAGEPGGRRLKGTLYRIAGRG